MKLKDYLLITFLTLISPFIYGYYFGILDHDHKLPYINKLINPALYPNDYYFSQPQSTYSVFNYLVVFFQKLTNLSLPWLYLLLYLATLWLLLLAIYRLTYFIYKNKTISLLAVSFFFLPKWAAQIGYQTHQFYFVTRDLSLAFSLLVLTLILAQKKYLAGFWIIIAFIVNPLIPLPVAVFWLVHFIKLPLFAFNSAWITSLKQRGTYSFPHLWRWTGWGNLVLFLSLLLIPFKFLKSKTFNQHTKTLKQFIFICLSLFLLQLFIGIMPLPVLVQFQFLRAINFIFILSLIAFASFIYKIINSQSRLISLLAITAALAVYFWNLHLTIWHFILIWSLPAAILLYPKKLKLIPAKLRLNSAILVLISLHAVYQLLVAKPQLDLPFYLRYQNPLVDVSDYSDWLAVQTWAKNHTPITAVLLTPPDRSGFRSFSQRSIVADAKDGGNIFYSQDFAEVWQQRINNLQSFDSFNLKGFQILKQKYPFDYLVLDNQHQLSELEPIYQNQSFAVYQL